MPNAICKEICSCAFEEKKLADTELPKIYLSSLIVTVL